MSINVNSTSNNGYSYDSSGVGEVAADSSGVGEASANSSGVTETAAGLIADNTKPGETVKEALGRSASSTTDSTDKMAQMNMQFMALRGNFLAAQLNAQLDRE